MQSVINKKKYKQALDYAYKLHIKQNRKGTGIPYFTHLVSVSNNIIEDGGSTDEAIGGLLHDAVEDQGGIKTLKEIKRKFGNKVATIVNECSDTNVEPKPPSPRKVSFNSSTSSRCASACTPTRRNRPQGRNRPC